MKIAILAWGSLLWEKGNLALANKWVLGGPKLPIEFSRVSVSRCGALTLVIDTKNGAENPTFFAESSFHNLGKAIRNLARREGTNPENIGYVTCRSEENRSRKPSVASKIRDWAENNNFDAVIWTDLPSNFYDKTHMKFTVDNAQKYLNGLDEPGSTKACIYIKNAPPEVETPLCKRMHDELKWLSKCS